jgi:glycosyltransferase involved in cell wall biosynthesis
LLRIILANNYARVTGGADLHCLELAKGLRERGHEVVFMATADEGNLDNDGVFVPTTVTRETRADTRGIEAAGVACRAVWNPSVATAAKQLILDFGPDVVHAHKLYPQLSVAPVVVASSNSIPTVQTAHDYEFISASALDSTGRRLDHDEERFAYRALNTALFGVKRRVHRPRIDGWISISRSAANVYRDHGIATSVLPNFTEPPAGGWAPFDSRSGVLFAGRLSEEKGVRHLLALARLIPHISILIAGGGPLMNEVKHAAETTSNVAYLGWLDRAGMARQLMSARVVVVPSLWQEPAGLAALEAMSAGTPLIVYDTGGLAEYVADASAGIIVPQSVKDLGAAITSLYDDRPQWEQFSNNARRGVEQNHSRSRYLDRLEEVYDAAIVQRRARRL